MRRLRRIHVAVIVYVAPNNMSNAVTTRRARHCRCNAGACKTCGVTLDAQSQSLATRSALGGQSLDSGDVPKGVRNIRKSQMCRNIDARTKGHRPVYGRELMTTTTDINIVIIIVAMIIIVVAADSEPS